MYVSPQSLHFREILAISSCVKIYGVSTISGLMQVLQYHFLLVLLRAIITGLKVL